jgi:hypothetical protein
MNADRTAMWIIAGGILAGVVVVLAVNGISGVPFEWWGVAGACVLAGVAFSLGYTD